VHCPRKSEGCRWKGELGKVEKHLSAGQLKGECQYIEVKCLLCSQNVLRDVLHRHISHSCPKRIIHCEYCGLESTHEEITKQHFIVCLKYPLFCPNQCSSDVIQRHKMSDHLEMCPEQIVACPFKEAGCEEDLLRKQLQQHLEVNTTRHQTLTWKAQQKEIMAMKNELAELKLKASQADYWVSGFQMMAEEVKKNNWEVYLTKMSKLVTSMSPPIAPIIIHMKINSNWSHSTIFCSHPHGYKMLLCARLHQKNRTYGLGGNIRKEEGIEIHFCTVEGQYDSSLVWPYKGKANIKLLNKKENANHITKEYAFTANKYCNAPVQAFPPATRGELFGHAPLRQFPQFTGNSYAPNVGAQPRAQQLLLGEQADEPFLLNQSTGNSVFSHAPNFGAQQLHPDPLSEEFEDNEPLWLNPHLGQALQFNSFQFEPVVQNPPYSDIQFQASDLQPQLGNYGYNNEQVHNNCKPVTPTIVLSKGMNDVSYSGDQYFEVTF